jgi:hypothetical protein
MIRRLVPLILTAFLTACSAPRARLSFPYRTLKPSPDPQWFDVDHNQKNDFAITFDSSGRVDALCYDDDEDGHIDRVYHLRDYADSEVPHLILLLDSVPYACVAERYAAGEFRFFPPPQKVIAPFPTLTEVCFADLLHAPPMPSMTDQHYDRAAGGTHDVLWTRFRGFHYPWERYLHYRASFYAEGCAYLDPRPWYHSELEAARQAFNNSPDRTTLVYLTTASAMACKFGRQGIDEILDGAAQLCLQLLYERRGAVRISMMADHGHNLTPSTNIDIEQFLRAGGFNPTDHLRKTGDVVLEINGLVTSAPIRTAAPAKVADCLLTHPGIDFAMYVESDHVLIRNAQGSAAIDRRDSKLRYRPVTRDVLGYQGALSALSSQNKLDRDGYATPDDWFAATADHLYPDAPSRLWDAFHRLIADPPELIFTTRDGYCAGLPSFQKYITMKSTHGSLNQVNSATFLLTMTRPATQSLRSRDILPQIAPTYIPAVRADR